MTWMDEADDRIGDGYKRPSTAKQKGRIRSSKKIPANMPNLICVWANDNSGANWRKRTYFLWCVLGADGRTSRILQKYSSNLELSSRVIPGIMRKHHEQWQVFASSHATGILVRKHTHTGTANTHITPNLFFRWHTRDHYASHSNSNKQMFFFRSICSIHLQTFFSTPSNLIPIVSCQLWLFRSYVRTSLALTLTVSLSKGFFPLFSDIRILPMAGEESVPVLSITRQQRRRRR